ncbi:MAG: CoA transferase [Deltaproteobacteria bacterium]|nr:CoA transferase [Deltaproteobacteria bacterium]
MSAPLAGIRVLDFGRYIAAPYAAALLADLGADVVRVERPSGGEDRTVAPVTDAGDGALFLQCNRGKRSLTLDPARPEGREVVRRLARTADVVVVNLPAAALAPLGLDYPTLSAERPELILAHVTAFGGRGPFADRVGFDGVGQAMSGAMYLSGVPGAPAKSIANYVDFTTALAVTSGVLAALWERAKTGRGQVVESSLLGSAIAVMGSTLLEQAALGLDRVGTGNRSQLSGPSDTFQTSDGFVLVQTVGQPLFARLCRMLGEPEMLDDPRFVDDAARGRAGEALSARLAAYCATRTTAEVLGALERARIPAGAVLRPREALEASEVTAAALFEAVPYPGAPAPHPVARAPFGLSGGGVAVRGRAPLLGEHTDEILGGLGYSADALAALRSASVI